jgi:hypothetical protein
MANFFFNINIVEVLKCNTSKNIYNDPQKKGLCIQLIEFGFITTHLIYSDIQKFKKKYY